MAGFQYFKTIMYLLFADDGVILVDDLRQVQKVLELFWKVAKHIVWCQMTRRC